MPHRLIIVGPASTISHQLAALQDTFLWRNGPPINPNGKEASHGHQLGQSWLRGDHPIDPQR